MNRIVIPALVGCGLSLGFGYLLLPLLRADWLPGRETEK